MPSRVSSILCCGLNNAGQLGIVGGRDGTRGVMSFFGCDNTRGDEEVKASQTSEGPLPIDNIRDIKCGGSFTVVLTDSGTMFICGTLNSTVYPTLTKINFMYPLKVVDIVCGKKHILALTDGGFVMSWGSGLFSQLGHGDDASWDRPKIIHRLEPKSLGCPVVSIAAGGSHSAVITQTGRVLTWGLNRSGQCGVGTDKDTIPEPIPIYAEEIGAFKASSIVCGRNHTAMLTVEGRVFVWGASSFGRLGILDGRKNKLYPTELTFFRTIPIHSIVSGDYHMLALGQDSSVYSWGYGSEGQTGHSTVFHVKTPRKIDYFDHMNVTSITCGATWSMATTQSGHLYAWGYGDGGWLGIKPPNMNSLPILDPDTIVENNPGNTSLLNLPPLTQAFDSHLNVLAPQRVKVSNFIEKVRCGGAHTIIFACEKAVISVVETDDSNLIGSSISKKNEYNNNLFNYLDNESKMRFESIAASLATVDKVELTDQLISWCRHRKLPEIVYVLSKGGGFMDINKIFDSNGNTPLIVACQNGHLGVVKMLVDSGADMNQTNKKGNTPLHYCFAYGFDEIGHHLISLGANEYAANNDGLTCYEGLSLADLDSKFK